MEMKNRLDGWLYPPIVPNWALVFYFSGDPEETLGREHYNSDAGKDVIKLLLREKMIEEDDSMMSGYKATKKLEFYVQHLCNQPFPEACFRIPETPDA